MFFLSLLNSNIFAAVLNEFFTSKSLKPDWVKTASKSFTVLKSKTDSAPDDKIKGKSYFLYSLYISLRLANILDRCAR